MGALETVRSLILRATDAGASEEEARTSALIACRMIRKNDFEVMGRGEKAAEPARPARSAPRDAAKESAKAKEKPRPKPKEKATMSRRYKGKYVFDLGYGEALRATDKALFVDLSGEAGGDGRVWIPRSQLSDDSEVLEVGDTGNVAVSAWFWEKLKEEKGW